MDGWLDGWMDGRTDTFLEAGCMDVKMNDWMDEWMEAQIGEFYFFSAVCTSWRHHFSHVLFMLHSQVPLFSKICYQLKHLEAFVSK